jgi:hypothetical protein
MNGNTVRTLGLGLVLAVALAVGALLGPAGAGAATPKLVASVGPGHTITLRTPAGAIARSVKAGVYTIVVRDRAADHDFRLTGPGVNKATGVGFVGTQAWKVRLAKGKSYRFLCDPHSDEMFGSFRVR